MCERHQGTGDVRRLPSTPISHNGSGELALAATRQVEGRDALASLNTQSMPPWLKFFTMSATAPPQSGTAPPQPELTATYCSPSCSQVIGEPTTPEPVLNFQTTSPVVSSTAWR